MEKVSLIKSFNMLSTWKKIYLAVAVLYFSGVSIFACLHLKIGSRYYFSDKFTNAHYDKTIELTKGMENKVPANQKISDNDYDISFENARKMCPVNKTAVISDIQKRHPQINWAPINRSYRIKMRLIGVFRIADGSIQYGYNIFIFWFLPVSILYLILSKCIFIRAGENRKK